MVPIHFSIPVAVGCVLTGALVIAAMLPSQTKKRLLKETAKVVLRGADTLGRRFPALREDFEDAIAEKKHEDVISEESEFNLDSGIKEQ